MFQNFIIFFLCNVYFNSCVLPLVTICMKLYSEDIIIIISFGPEFEAATTREKSMNQDTGCHSLTSISIQAALAS